MHRNKSDAPLFSIVTPVYNGIQFLESYVSGLQQQQYCDWEAIVIDDCSTDRTLEILETLVSCDRRFRLARNTWPKKISGPYQARNLGIELARGIWICFLDIDDIWLPCKLARQAHKLQARPQLQLLYSAYWRAARGSCLGYRRPCPPFLRPHHWILVANPVPMLTACVRRDLARASRFQELHHEDYLYWRDLFKFLSKDQVFADAEPLAVYCLRSGSLSSNKWKASLWIWRCYRKFGYPLPLALFAMLLRSLLQFWYLIYQVRVRPLPLDWPGSEKAWPVFKRDSR